jgi:hypothetical protein
MVLMAHCQLPLKVSSWVRVMLAYCSFTFGKGKKFAGEKSDEL